MDGTQISPYLTTPNAGASSNPGYADILMNNQNNFAKGVSSLGEGIGEAIKMHKQNMQDSADLDTTFHMLTPMMAKAGAPIDPDLLTKYGSSSLSQKRGIVGALATTFATSQKAKLDAAQTQEAQARAGYYGDVGQARIAAQQEQADTDQGITALFQQFGNMKPSGEDGSWTQGDIVKAVGSAGSRLNPRAQAALIKQVFPSVMGNGASYDKPSFTDVPGSNASLATYGKQAFIVPKAGVKTDMVDDGNGGQVPVIQDSKGRVIPLKTNQSALQNKFPTFPKGTKFDPDTITATLPDGTVSVIGHKTGAISPMGQLQQLLKGGQPTAVGGDEGAGVAPVSAPAAPAAGAIPPDHIDWLIAHPEQAASFDAKYGAGASEQYLKQ